MQIKPLFDRVLLRPTTETVTDAGIYVPKDALERSLVMTVMAVGDGVMEDGTRTTMVVKPADCVLVAKYAGTEVAQGEEKWVMVRQCDLLATIVASDQ